MRRQIIQYSLLILLFCSRTVHAGNYVIINQVMYDTPLNERVTTPPYSNGEFVELYNGSNEAVSLNNWHLCGENVSEQFLFQNISIPSKGYLVVAFRHEASPLFTLDNLYTLPAGNPNVQIIYQNTVILANFGETIQLHNAGWQLVDQITYDGSSHPTKPDRLRATNQDSIPGDQCVSLHRTWVEFEQSGLVVQGTSQWKTGRVSFGECQLAETTFGEHNLTGSQPLPTGENYIVSVAPLDPTTRVSVTDGSISVSNGVRTRTIVQYYDGLGRPDEQIAVESAPDRHDLVQTTYYSDLHRATQQWLPVAMQTQGQRIDVSSFEGQSQSYYGDERPYTETLYEHSALDRITGQKRPGQSYSSHPSTNTYSINDGSDNVRIYSVKNDGRLKTTGSNYASGTLYKTTIVDEDEKPVTIYTDKLGRTIMEKRGDNRTYYVYDNFGRLRFVLPHLAASKLNNGEYALINSVLRAAAYCYKYDSRGNMIYKRLPGCGAQKMVYDLLGQMVLKQDGNQYDAHKWTMYAYDSIGRNLYTAEVLLSANHEYYISYFADRWYVEHYGNNPSSTSLAGTGYASSVFPKTNLKLLTLNYYDDYDYLSRLSTPLRQAIRFAQEYGYGLQHDNATGLLTGTRVYNLSEDGYTAAAYYYDTKGRIVQSRSVRSTDGYKTAASTEYLFDGEVAQQLSVQGTDSNLIREHYRYNYDHAGRTKKVFYQLNDDEEIALSELSYDNIGRLVQNLLYNKRDTILYSYDMRSMLTETRHKHYNKILYYADDIDNNDITPCYNGNISAVAEDGSLSGYEYDNMNRLTMEFGFIHKVHLGMVKIPVEQFSYDDAGNIISLKRRGQDDLTLYYGSEGNQLLSITEEEESPDLYDVIEFPDRSPETEDPLLYDANGNLIRDAYRYISCIKYNILNLPDTIQFINGHQIVNLYDATGRKYKTVNYINMRSVNTDYNEIAYYTYDTDSVEYQVTEYMGNIMNIRTKEDTVITDKQKIFNATGYYADGKYYHYVKNHLGSICLVIESETDHVVQNTSYSASGVPSSTNLDEQPYLYNGKEFISAHGLNEYDIQARMYYPVIMRTTTMDPMAEKYYHISPYAWCGNNPTKFVDPDGRVVIDIQGHLVREVPEAAFDEDKKYYQGFDWIRFIDANGNVRLDDGEPMEMCFGKEGTVQLIENKDKYVVFKVEGDEAGTNLLKFLAQTGAMVEWSQLKTGVGTTGINYLSTSWDKKTNTSTNKVLSSYLPPATRVLREYIHSHPLDDPNPSGMHDRTNPETGRYEKAGTWGDVGVKNFYQAQSQYGANVVFKIYLPALDDYVIF